MRGQLSKLSKKPPELPYKPGPCKGRCAPELRYCAEPVTFNLGEIWALPDKRTVVLSYLLSGVMPVCCKLEAEAKKLAFSEPPDMLTKFW